MKNTRDIIIELADELIRLKGYNAFSYSDISKQLNVRNAAIHYHFPTKPDLALAVVQFHAKGFEKFTEKAAEKDALQAIRLFLNFYSSIQISGKICIIGAYATDWHSMNEETRAELKVFTEMVIQWISETLRRGKKEKVLTFKGNSHAKALSILTNIFASAQLARITGKEDFNSIKEQIITTITL